VKADPHTSSMGAAFEVTMTVKYRERNNTGVAVNATN
jgi:hypothetical protein